jgi:hypothetical protein
VSNGQAEPSPQPAVRGIVRLIVTNSSLIAALLFYMGWAYEDAFYGYFHIDPLNFGAGLSSYVLHSLSLFSPSLIVVAVLVIVVFSSRTWPPSSIRPSLRGRVARALSRFVSLEETRRRRLARRASVGIGVLLTLTGLSLDWTESRVHVSTYVLLALLGGGPLLITWHGRTDTAGRLPYALAAIVALVCMLWAASLYAHDVGIRNAEAVVNNLSSRNAVAIYSVDSLALTGPGITVESLPQGYSYHYLYQGLRLLLSQSGTYYLLPVGWSRQYDITYIVDSGSGIRIELY